MPFVKALRVPALVLLLLLAPAGAAHAAVTVTGEARAEADGKVVFTVKSDALLGDVVAIATKDGTAKAGTDYTARSEDLVTIPRAAAADPGTAFEVIVSEDVVAEGDEAFELVVTPVNGAPVMATGTIRNDDTPPLQLVAPALKEGGEGKVVLGLVVPTTETVTARLATKDGTALAGQDFEALNAQVVFAPGEQVKELTLKTLQDDGAFEGPEALELTLSAEGAAPVRGAVPVTLAEDDAPPTLAMTGAPPVAEGDGPGTVTGARLTLSRAAAVPVVVKVGTFGASAAAGEDFVPVLGEITFAPGEVDKVQLVEVKGDTTIEKNERFRLIAAAGANVLVPGDALVVDLQIDNDDRDTAAPVLAVSGVKLSRGVLSATVACPAGEERCSGRVTFFKDADRKAKDRRLRPERRLGQVAFAAAGGASQVVRLRLRATDRALLRRVTSAKLSAFAMGKDAAGNAAPTVRRTVRVKTR